MHKFAAFLKTVDEKVVEDCSKVDHLGLFQSLNGRLPEIRLAAQKDNSNIAAKIAFTTQSTTVNVLKNYLNGLVPSKAPIFDHLYKEHYNLFMDYYESLMALYKMYVIQTDEDYNLNNAMPNALASWEVPDHPLYESLFAYHELLVSRLLSIHYSKRKD